MACAWWVAGKENHDEVSLLSFPDAGHRNTAVRSQEIYRTSCVTAKYQFLHLLPACAVCAPSSLEHGGERKESPINGAGPSVTGLACYSYGSNIPLSVCPEHFSSSATQNTEKRSCDVSVFTDSVHH